MKRIFVETNEFRARWSALGFADEDVAALQDYLLEHPDRGRMIQGTGGVRKLRWARAGHGKSGGARVIYIDFIDKSSIFLITVFGKSEQADLSASEKKAIRSFVKDQLGEH